jgi:hypothetical protein
MTTKLYDPGQIVIAVGPNIISGAAPGTFVEVEQDEDTFTQTTGAGGETALTRNRNQAGKVTITLMQGSTSNDVLSALHETHKLTGVPPGACRVADLLGTTLVGGDECFITKPAPVGFGKDYGERKWVIGVPKLGGKVGGGL